MPELRGTLYVGSYIAAEGAMPMLVDIDEARMLDRLLRMANSADQKRGDIVGVSVATFENGQAVGAKGYMLDGRLLVGFAAK